MPDGYCGGSRRSESHFARRRLSHRRRARGYVCFLHLRRAEARHYLRNVRSSPKKIQHHAPPKAERRDVDFPHKRELRAYGDDCRRKEHFNRHQRPRLRRDYERQGQRRPPEDFGRRIHRQLQQVARHQGEDCRRRHGDGLAQRICGRRMHVWARSQERIQRTPRLRQA